MTEIFKNLFVGSETDYEFIVRNQEGWNVIHACKEPYYRRPNLKHGRDSALPEDYCAVDGDGEVKGGG